MPTKHKLEGGQAVATKRPRPNPNPNPNPTPAPRRSSADRLSPLSDELLIRILALLTLPQLLSVAPVSRRFYRLAADSELWKALYYSRFVQPRAMRVPGTGRRRRCPAAKAVCADGRRAGWLSSMRGGRADGGPDRRPARDWKRQYKLRHNWARGKCAVEELRVDADAAAGSPDPEPAGRMIVKVAEGIAVTADPANGLRAWDLRTKDMLAHSGLGCDAPSCMTIQDQALRDNMLDIAVGFTRGSFGVWRLDISQRRFELRYRHHNSSLGQLVGVALSLPYVLTATESVVISLYSFEPHSGGRRADAAAHDAGSDSEKGCYTPADGLPPGPLLPAPYLLTSLKSHSSRAPLALSIRKSSGATIASIAYTFPTLQGWSVGIQDLQFEPRNKHGAETIKSRLAYTLPVRSSSSSSSTVSGSRRSVADDDHDDGDDDGGGGPTAICYMHPYLLATLPDNTLMLHLCTSNASSLSISSGVRLWGHTSGVSDAEITSRGKAVSVSGRGEEIRVWELEGRAEGRSVEVRPATAGRLSGLDERRNWVGFDEEMVIVLKESRHGRESLMVYDFA